MALYEPLHEEIGTLTPALIALRQADAWESGHGAMAPYFAEFAPLLRSGLVGVPGYRMAFATSDAFAGATADLPELATYLRRLLRYAAVGRRVPVLKFCRSMGRVAWMQAQFPTALHAVVLRRPDTQWASARQQMQAQGNPYFVVMPLLVLARNAAAPLVARCCAALDVQPPRLRRDLLERGFGLCEQVAEHLPWAPRWPVPWLRRHSLSRARAICAAQMECRNWDARYRVFLAYWMACTLSALATDSLLIDPDQLVASAACRDELAATLARRCGVRLDLPVDPARPVRPAAPLAGEAAAAQRAALALLEEAHPSLRPEAYALAHAQLAAGLPG